MGVTWWIVNSGGGNGLVMLEMWCWLGKCCDGGWGDVSSNGDGVVVVVLVCIRIWRGGDMLAVV